MAYRIIKRNRGQQTIRVDYDGGAYIELTFGHTGYKPTEVINVYDYETGKPEQPFDQWEQLPAGEQSRVLKAEVEDWITSNVEDGWVDWYDGYLENARY